MILRKDSAFGFLCELSSWRLRDAEMANVPFLEMLAECSARHSECSVASHTSEEKRRNAPVSASRNGILAVSASLRPIKSFDRLRACPGMHGAGDER